MLLAIGTYFFRLTFMIRFMPLPNLSFTHKHAGTILQLFMTSPRHLSWQRAQLLLLSEEWFVALDKIA